MKKDFETKSKFNIYSDGNYFGKYYIRNLPTGLKIIDDSNNFIKNDGYLIGDTSNDSIRVSKINVEVSLSKIKSDQINNTFFFGSSS